MESLRIVGLSVLATVAYREIHDQITGWICLEYFTVWHPHVIDSASPTVMAILWGCLATWWSASLWPASPAWTSGPGCKPAICVNQSPASSS